MTSPLSILRKNRRAPLPDLHTDGERKPHKERSDSDYEEKLFQDIFPQNQPVPRVPDHLSTLRSKFMQKKKAKAAVPSDFELMSSMMQKICHLERKVKTQAVDIEQKARRIAVLEEKLNILREAKVLEESASNENQDEGLVQFCLKLQKQVWEMEECMQDLMDGFFPSELQERFPNGVPFQVNDRREEEFIVRRPRAEFPGRGQTIDGGQQMMDSSEISSTIPKQSQIAGRKLSMEQFLRKLPETVVKAGKVISIRDSVKAHLLGLSDDAKSRSAIIVETSALQSSRECENDSSKSAKDVSTLRVKSEDGTDTFIIKMYFTETIGDLRQYLDVKRGPSAASYDIISAFPQRRYSDDTQTLLACGLTPNAALLLRAQAPAHRH
ncbi:UBX domain-containing protein 11 isoform X2 [Danio rerio]|uniref:UBX domain-containing protein 11 isoform X2 n=3 Tax=Danio rerio TaxID=7955 RepID=A0AC58HL29_DANRE|nr:UBX domain-containing protein 11 isoform X2 [Danio rerio]|eukprot:XP_009290859.1 UBX domain-containing protein 11 isoform X2 [Danio rerio]